ncbi:hypothetical protein [Bradyrhizobium sp. SZCCHNRI1002]|uniref:hypothetical protein n=1 Tax=Bradyrhizobium sp. SZCCHNRI1002 TaxID=3057274 RepID=UPI0028EAE3AA|nr:hypothetical protein [Bradyrhizobium sp. SZCCHNRI1002]
MTVLAEDEVKQIAREAAAANNVPFADILTTWTSTPKPSHIIKFVVPHGSSSWVMGLPAKNTTSTIERRFAELGDRRRLIVSYEELQSAFDEVIERELVEEADAAAEGEMLGDMVAFDSTVTGIHNTIFVSTKAGVRHGPRIKVAINPPTHFRADGENASVTFDGRVIPDGAVPAALLSQLQEFINQNRAVLFEYWDQNISTNELQRRLHPIEPK